MGDKAIPFGSKICAKRVQQKMHDQHMERIRTMRPTVDTRPPMVAHLDHVKVNLKKEQMMEDRYSEIDRDNRILLKKMTEIMKQQGSTAGATPRSNPGTPRQGPISLNRDSRKKELLRITRENQSILKRIQQAQPVYNHVEWEDEHRKNALYLKNRCEFPLILRTPRAASSELVQLGEQDGPRAAMQKDLQDGSNKYVLKEGMKLSETYYLVDMSTDGRNLFVSAYDSNTRTNLELSIKEKTHRQLYRETNGDYQKIAQRLRVSDQGRLLLDGEEEDGASLGDELDAEGMVARHD
ncbi:unnamed protein product [Polarella glacialis]|uniref:Uncharacterized protein n=1 Tax=Polarella glacialis TaxID=89957 RepID=A0A813K935_POLGL|nr:unnamed protein product [Polarella glacialis]